MAGVVWDIGGGLRSKMSQQQQEQQEIAGPDWYINSSFNVSGKQRKLIEK